MPTLFQSNNLFYVLKRIREPLVTVIRAQAKMLVTFRISDSQYRRFLIDQRSLVLTKKYSVYIGSRTNKSLSLKYRTIRVDLASN